MTPVALDFETFFHKKLKYGLKHQIAETYIRDERFHPYVMSVCDGTTSWAGEPRDFNWAVLDGKLVLSHNSAFDRQVWWEMHRRGWVPKPNPAGYACTANLTSYICNRRSLDHAVEFLYKIKLDKSVRDDMDGKRWPNDLSEAERAKLIKYADTDAIWCWRLWNDYSPQWPILEQRLSEQTIAQGIRGIAINKELLMQYILASHEMKTATEKILPWIADDESEDWENFNTSPTSVKCIAEQCKRSGIPCPPVKAHEGEEAYTEWEETYRKTCPWIPALSSWRSVNKLYKSFLLMKERLRPDNTMPFGLKYFGAHTGRWSGSEKINLQNPRKKPILANESGLMETNELRIDAALKLKSETGVLPDWVRHSIDFRALLVPRPGYKMICSDLAQIEPRVLAWLVGDTETLKAISGGMSIYEAFARSNMGYTGGRMDKASDEYKLVKIQVLQLGYQAGWSKFISTALTEGGVDLTANDPEFIEVTDPITHEVERVPGYGMNAKKIVSDFREKNTRITGLWATLDDQFKRSIGGEFKMVLPSGRIMHYRDVRCSVRIVPDKKTGKPRREWVFTAESDYRRKSFYGGKLTENLVQAAARDVFAEGLIRIEDAGHSVLFSSHDEAICEVKPDVTAAEIEGLMSVTPDWLPGCPIAAEAKEVAHYIK